VLIGAGTGKCKIINIFGSNSHRNLFQSATYSRYCGHFNYSFYKTIILIIYKIIILSEVLLSNDILHLISEG